MIPLKCSVVNCFNHPTKAYTINNKALFQCDRHHLNCQVDECKGKPVSCYRRQNKKIYYCGFHRNQFQVKQCIKNHCQSLAIYNYSKYTMPILCIKHRKSNMSVIYNKCAFFGCHKEPKYNTVSRFRDAIVPRGLFCHRHRKRKMITLAEFMKIQSISDNVSSSDTISTTGTISTMDAISIQESTPSISLSPTPPVIKIEESDENIDENIAKNMNENIDKNMNENIDENIDENMDENIDENIYENMDEIEDNMFVDYIVLDVEENEDWLQDYDIIENMV